MAALHLDNLLFLLFVAVAIFFQLLTSPATLLRKRPGDTTRRSSPPSQMSRPIPREIEETDEDRVRKFLEALGQPATAKPPPPVIPRTDIPPRPVAPISPPRETVLNPTWRDLKRVAPKKAMGETRMARPKVAEPPVFEEHESPAPEPPPSVTKAAEDAYAIVTQPISKSTDSKIDIVTMLRSTSGLRDAIILREIFGPPRSLQPLDLVGNV